jgi:transcriptional regulator GlxA family with amidase domain
MAFPSPVHVNYFSDWRQRNNGPPVDPAFHDSKCRLDRAPSAFPAAKRSVNETRMVPRVSVQYSLGIDREENGRAIVLHRRDSYSPTMNQLKVVTYIDSNLSGALFVGALARIAGVSSRGFHRAFRQRFGITPHAYVILKRIELAQNLMLTTGDSLSQIALACGMTDQSHFTRTFRRIIGQSPRQWRTSRLGHARGAQ